MREGRDRVGRVAGKWEEEREMKKKVRDVRNWKGSEGRREKEGKERW